MTAPGLGLTPTRPAGLHVLCLGAHPDDIEIGAGGTILTLAGAGRIGRVTWVVLSGTAERVAEGRSSAAAFLDGVEDRSVTFHDFRDGYFPSCSDDIKDVFEQLKPAAPDLILCPRLDDAHQDHRVVAELTWNTFRHHLVLEYEVPKYDGDLVTPNAYVPLTPAVLDRKVERLTAGFPSQAGRSWFDPEVFRGLARLRGLEAGPGVRFAEGFRARKLVLDIAAAPPTAASSGARRG